MIPEEYYKAKHLRKRVQKPCEVASTTEKFCVDYKYLNITRTDVITVPTKYGQLVGAKKLLPYAPFEGVVLNRLVSVPMCDMSFVCVI